MDPKSVKLSSTGSNAKTKNGNAFPLACQIGKDLEQKQQKQKRTLSVKVWIAGVLAACAEVKTVSIL